MLYSWAHTTTGRQNKMSRCQTMLGEICMNAFQVTCPGCGTILKLPAGFSAGKIKCPKCAKVLALQNPSPSPTPAPQQPVSQASPQAKQSDGASPFDSLPAFGSPSSGQPGIGLPASQPPAQLPSHAAAFHQPKAGNSRNAAKPKQRKTSKGSPLKIVLIVVWHHRRTWDTRVCRFDWASRHWGSITNWLADNQSARSHCTNPCWSNSKEFQVQFRKHRHQLSR